MSSVKKKNYLCTKKIPNVIISLLFFGFATVCVADIDDKELTLADAEKMALSDDPFIARSEAMKDDLAFRSIAANSWPDPKLKLGVMNFPTEEYNFEKLDMTQAILGITQRFPPAGAVGAKRDELGAMSEANENEIDLRKLESRRNIRLSWMSVYLYYQSQKLVHESLSVFAQLKKITRLQYRNGQGSQADVIRAQLEESLLIDQETSIAEKYDKALAELRYWMNVKELTGALNMAFPSLPELPEAVEIDRSLASHPLLKSGENRVKAAKSGVEFTNTQFYPGWSLDVSYGYRGGNRSDLASVMMMFDLPFFTGSKQSRELQASQSRLSIAKYNLEDRRRQLRRRYDSGLAEFRRADERLNLYDSQVLPQAEQNTEATLNAYQSGVTPFGILIRARLTQLRSHLQRLQLKVARTNAQIELLYLAGGR